MFLAVIERVNRVDPLKLTVDSHQRTHLIAAATRLTESWLLADFANRIRHCRIDPY
jgi:hypothetical protein